MRSITGTLLAAAQSWQGIPIAKATIANKRPRWSLHRTDTGYRRRTDTCSQDGLILRARSSNTNVQVARVTDPDDMDQWIAWVNITTNVNNSDIALAQVATDQYRLFYTVAGFNVEVIESSDGGENWGAPTTVVAALGSAPFLSAAALYLVVQLADLKLYTKPWSGGAWGLDSTRNTEVITTAYGVGMDYFASGDSLYIIVAGDHKLWTFVYQCVSNSWVGPFWLLPGAEGDPPALVIPKNPDIINTADDLRVATWTEHSTGTPTAYDRGVLRTSLDGRHFGNEVTLPDDPIEWNRYALAWNSTDRYLWAACERRVFKSRTYHADDSQMNAGPFDVVRYRRQKSYGEPGELTLTILDENGEYQGLGTVGEKGEPFQALSELIVSRGYTTSIGDETEDLNPHYITQVHYYQGTDPGRIEIRATDGLGLMALWHPDRSSTWGSHSLAWLLDEIAAQVGLRFIDPETTPFLRTLTYFTWSPINSAQTVLRQLLKLAGAFCYFHEDGHVRAATWPYAYPGSPGDVGDQAEIIRGFYGPRLIPFTALHAHSYDYADLAENATDTLSLGIRLHRSLQDNRINSAAMAQEVTGADLQLAHAFRRQDIVTVPMRPDLEMWDLVELTADTDLVPTADNDRLVVAIEELRDAPYGRFESILSLIAPDQ